MSSHAEIASTMEAVQPTRTGRRSASQCSISDLRAWMVFIPPCSESLEMLPYTTADE
jgi:hypothetical protein